MYYEVYLDVFFVLNGTMDYFLLRLVNRLLHGSATPGRSLLGALAGAAGACIPVIFPGNRFLNTILVHVIINTIMVRFGCNLKKIRVLIKGVFLLYAAAFLLGGMMQLLKTFTGTEGICIFLATAAVSQLILTVGLRAYIRGEKREKQTYRILLYADGKCKEGTALLDTGNSLTDPASGKPVSVGTIQMLDGLLPEETRKQLEDFWEGKISKGDFGNLNPHFLPFTSLGRARGIALAVTLDYLCMEGREIHKVITRPVIAFSRENSSFLGDYQMILHPNLIDS
ncbi:MAG: sigma-E processing peptidase SpoIIGA [Clostridiales bacterium]|nr:sigma-E processing peptidase SpoIIGA [Clostridiales bacterium]